MDEDLECLDYWLINFEYLDCFELTPQERTQEWVFLLDLIRYTI